MKKKPHGNSHQNMEEHHLYEIQNRERGGVYKYGICGDPLNADGSSPRANKQVRLFNRVVGWTRFLAKFAEDARSLRHFGTLCVTV